MQLSRYRLPKGKFVHSARNAEARCGLTPPSWPGFHQRQSDDEHDGHWGGFQLRNPTFNGPNGLTEDTIVAGFGFELTPDDVLREIRYQVEPIDDDDRETVRPDLLPLLAHPWRANESPD